MLQCKSTNADNFLTRVLWFNVLHYHLQQSCGEVIFSQASVSYCVHGGYLPLGRYPPRTVTAADGMHPTRMLSCFYTVFMGRRPSGKSCIRH